MTAIGVALSALNTTLADEYSTFVAWNAATGSRAGTGGYANSASAARTTAVRYFSGKDAGNRSSSRMHGEAEACAGNVRGSVGCVRDQHVDRDFSGSAGCGIVRRLLAPPRKPFAARTRAAGPNACHGRGTHSYLRL